MSIDINSIIDQFVLRPGAPYLSPAHTLTAVNGPWGVPYWMQGLPLQTCTNMTIEAPAPAQKSVITYATPTLSTKSNIGSGSAPTSGVYTGVEDHCG